MRGKPFSALRSPSLRRIIPARAGQTSWRHCVWTATPDHPRACGANLIKFTVFLIDDGSSPRVRGKPTNVERTPYAIRIIPARAGQTAMSASLSSPAPDHPRACGANLTPTGSNMVGLGSSPRVRGKLLSVGQAFVSGRIIPARAGQTGGGFFALRQYADHPRACGANAAKLALPSLPSGSSPRVRGKQSDFMRKLLSAGPSIIGFAQWLQSSCYCSCFQSSAKTPISRGTTPTSLFLGFQNSITLLLLT